MNYWKPTSVFQINHSHKIKKWIKKSIQKTWDYRSYFLLSFSGWHSIVVMHGGWFVPFFSFFSCGFFFGQKDDKRQNNRTILTIKDYKKKNTSKPNDKLQTIRRQIQPPKSDLICRLFPWGFVISLPQITKRRRQVFIVWRFYIL